MRTPKPACKTTPATHGADGPLPNPRVIFWNPNTSQYFLTHQILCQKTTYIECEIAARHDYMRKFHGYKLLREDLGRFCLLDEGRLLG
jgi:hypothetical protein